MIYLDLDDFHEFNTSWNLLCHLHEQIPQFKVTLFTIPGLCSRKFLDEMRLHPWLDMVPHGYLHSDCYECLHTTAETMALWIQDYVALGFTTKGFKAPGWQISDGCYTALRSRNWWVADQVYNRPRRPVGLRVYELDSFNKVHGHIGHMGGHNTNALELIMDQILALRAEPFGLIKDYMKEKT